MLISTNLGKKLTWGKVICCSNEGHALQEKALSKIFESAHEASEKTPCYHVHRISCQSPSLYKHTQNELVRDNQCLFTTFQILLLCA